MTPVEIVNEFKRKYESTYLFVQMPDNPESNLFFLNRVTANSDGGGVMQLHSEEFGKIALNINTAHSIKFTWPKVGVFQNGKDACLFLREPRRQWQRGVCSGNSSIIPVWSIIEATGSTNQGMFDFTSVANAHAAKTYNYHEAVKMLASGKYRSVALANGFSLCLSVSEAYEYLLLYWTSVVAGVKGDKLTVLESSLETSIAKVTA